MKTVLFIDKGCESIWQSFQRLAFLTDGWQLEGLFELCPWMGDGRTAREAVPSLETVLDGETDWMAIVACDLREEVAYRNGAKGLDVHFDNPFDFANRYDCDPTRSMRESSHALVRLCQMLGGLPDKAETQHNSTLDQSLTELIERYRTGLPRPKRIICITPRSFDEESVRVASSELRENGCIEVLENGFWDRNDYPASTRFVVFDWQDAAQLLPEQQQGLLDLAVRANEIDLDPLVEERATTMRWIRYWCCVLSFATADIWSSDLKPYRLYRTDASVSHEQLRKAFAPRYSEWLGMQSLIDEQVTLEERRLERLRETGGQIPLLDVTIDVKSVDRDRATYLDRKAVKLIRDRPQNDFEVWNAQRGVADEVVDEIERIPARELRHSVDEFKKRSVLGENELEYCVLTDDQVLDFTDEAVREEIGLAHDTNKRAFSQRTHRQELNKLSKRVVSAINERPRPMVHRRSVLWIAGGFVLGLLAFITALEVDATLSHLLPLFLAPLTTTLLCVVVVLFWQRFHVRDGYDEVEWWLHSSVERSNDESARVGTRLSRYARVRRLHAILVRQLQLGASTRSIKELREKQGLLLERMDSVATTVGVPDIDRWALQGVSLAPWGVASTRLEDKEFYCAVRAYAVQRPLNPELNDLRNVDVPFGFIDAITLLPLRVFEEGK